MNLLKIVFCDSNMDGSAMIFGDRGGPNIREQGARNSRGTSSSTFRAEQLPAR